MNCEHPLQSFLVQTIYDIFEFHKKYNISFYITSEGLSQDQSRDLDLQKQLLCSLTKEALQNCEYHHLGFPP